MTKQTSIDHLLFINSNFLDIDSFDVCMDNTTADEFVAVFKALGFNTVINIIDGPTYKDKLNEFLYININSFENITPSRANITIDTTTFPVITLKLEDYACLLNNCVLFGNAKGTQIFLEGWIARDGNIIRAGAYAI